MSPEHEEVMRLTGEIQALCFHQILMAAMRGDGFRSLQQSGHLQVAVAKFGNEIEARLLISLIDELEKLIQGGMGLVQALEALRSAGWLDRIAHHTSLNTGA